MLQLVFRVNELTGRACITSPPTAITQTRPACTQPLHTALPCSQGCHFCLCLPLVSAVYLLLRLFEGEHISKFGVLALVRTCQRLCER